jgi:hypothetical protein
VHEPVSPSGDRRPVLGDDVRRRLVDTYLNDVEKLAKRLPQIDLSLWPNFADMDPR